MANETPPSKDSGGKSRPPQRGLFLALLMFVFFLILAFATPSGVGGSGSESIDILELEGLLAKNEVDEIRFKEDQATVKLRPGNLGVERDTLVYTIHLNSPEAALRIEALASQLHADRGIETRVHADPKSFLTQLLFYMLPMLLLVGVLYFFMFRQMRGPGGPGSLLNFGKSKHKVVNDKVNVTLRDVAGVEEARQDIEEVISFLKDPTRFTRLGGRMPKGVLLVGPPGTGKTLLAKATAGEAGVPFYSVAGSDFVEMFVGVGASRVRDLFEKAKESSPCIIFLDEVDAVGRRRGNGMSGGHDEREQTLNQILVEMDGFDTDRGIIIMAATNRPDILDPALLRPGRFDRQIVIGMPNVDAREQILEVHARGKAISPAVDLGLLARATPGFSGAELEALLNEAALAAAVHDQESITMSDLEEARDRIRFGRAKKSWSLVEEEVKATAYHEAGHALVAALVEGCDPLHKVTVVPRGRALGMTMSLPERDQLTLTRRGAEARIRMAFGGRIGEEICIDDFSSGAQNDIQQATSWARRMVTEWGMSPLGPIMFANKDSELMYLGGGLGQVKEFSEATMERIDLEIKNIIDVQYQRAHDVIHGNLEALKRIAEALIRFETVSGEEVDDLIAGRVIDRPSAGEIRANEAAREGGEDRETEDSETEDSETEDSETEDSETEDSETEDSETEDSETEQAGTDSDGEAGGETTPASADSSSAAFAAASEARELIADDVDEVVGEAPTTLTSKIGDRPPEEGGPS
ncbi:MAG: ATP-dependent zinc metalloprotease FtsH [Planctomycetes bacterium]|nr:ATP-dependent zinc metalloprotease FtsH [Planctomycetota bacterium]